ncbi:gluconokinase [Chitinophaga sancti]|uniref:Gluconate kinase, FGGY family n=1 Tax=Chitinophaga sancti TaxID=1004 RepID=A0A1K1SYY5_9BACT|nr:gluconokinase [Chitinophaga sancti]WQD60521.1 gluconokinase [Chitinophaga sancti]WQG87352.1 gluconokinase [Chitinophaga sancti]SFW89287.1 gluconate kinase, FGGY family [Chitinophaga sancti]
MAYIIGVDIGTSSAKVIAVKEDGSVKAHCQQEYTIHQPQAGYSEQDPAYILAAVKSGIRSVATIMREAPAAVSFSSAMHSVMMMSGQGAAMSPLIIWADNRSEGIADRLRDTPQGNRIYQQTGTPIHAMSPLCKIMWWKENEPENHRQAACFIGIKEYIFYHFFGKYITDHSIASATGLFNIHELRWNADSLALAGITEKQLPEAVGSETIITGLDPAIAAELDLPVETKFIAGASDGCLAQLGSNALDAGHASLTIGTSGAVRMAVPTAMTDQYKRLFTYILTPGHFVIGGAINNGGVLLQWYLDKFLQAGMSIDVGLQKAFDTPAGAEGVICLPYLHGERAPVWDGHAKGAFIGVQPQHTQWHFMRAILEGMAYGLLNITKALEETTGAVKKISVSGGFTASKEWVQLLADVFQQPMYMTKESDASALGAVLLAAEAIKLTITLAAQEEIEVVPDPAKAALYQKSYEIYIKLYEALKPVFPIM